MPKKRRKKKKTLADYRTHCICFQRAGWKSHRLTSKPICLTCRKEIRL